jgi:hypothetical protein
MEVTALTTLNAVHHRPLSNGMVCNISEQHIQWKSEKHITYYPTIV